MLKVMNAKQGSFAPCQLPFESCCCSLLALPLLLCTRFKFCLLFLITLGRVLRLDVPLRHAHHYVLQRRDTGGR